MPPTHVIKNPNESSKPPSAINPNSPNIPLNVFSGSISELKKEPIPVLPKPIIPSINVIKPIVSIHIPNINNIFPIF
jgi:hypothetical protein